MPDQSQLTPPPTPVGETPPASSVPIWAVLRSQTKNLLILTLVLLVCFAKSLYDLLRFALKSQLFSHVLLIPFISGYLVWINRNSLPHLDRPNRGLAVGLWCGALLVLASYWVAAKTGFAGGHDYLTWTTLSLVLFFNGACAFCLPRDTVRALAFPLCFLLFAVPLPLLVVDWTETFLQHASASGAELFFTLTDTTFLRDGLVFQLPNIRIQVAPECSGIHSTLVLFITSVLAGQMFLVTPWKRALLALVVIPLGILRNAFRIWTLGQLCIHISPDMIHSPIHHRGGPIFFVLSLIPFGLLLVYLRKTDKRRLQ